VPRYDFKCETCGRLEEWFITFEQFDTTTPMCCAKPMHQVFHPPSLQTDTRFQIGHEESFDETTPHGRFLAKRRVNGAKKAGVNPNTGAWWCSQIGPPDDPKAWVRDRSDIKRVCRERGYGCEQLGIKPEEFRGDHPLDAPYRPADDLVQEQVNRELAGVDASPEDRAALVEKTREEIAGTQ